jgi:hypothetical protein
VVDDQHPLEQVDDVADVVGGEDHRRAAVAVEGAEERPHRRLGLDVEADCRLVEEQHARRGQDSRRQLAPHALAE